ncbi:MAG: hypothetical protein U5M53_07040 [Rhodoferax sp.]|nr:hypothetical protein [Rhodoferax sp.]
MPLSKAEAQANPLRNIQRIDKGHHAWRVVMRRQHQHLRQLFTDSVYGSKEQALAAAIFTIVTRWKQNSPGWTM